MRLPEIRTERLLLRPWTREDVDALHGVWTAPEVRRYLASAARGGDMKAFTHRREDDAKMDVRIVT